MTIFVLIGFAYILGILFFFRKIFLATKIFRRASFLYKRTWQMKSLLALGILSILFLTFFFLYILISASSNGKIIKQKATIVDGKYLNFIPNVAHRIILWLDFILLYLCYTVIITVMELFASFSVSAWYFSRKKKEATLPTTMFMKTALRYHFGTVCKLSILKWGFKQIRNLAWVIRKQLRSGN